MRVNPRRSKGRRRDEGPTPAPASPDPAPPRAPAETIEAAQPFYPASAPQPPGARPPAPEPPGAQLRGAQRLRDSRPSAGPQPMDGRAPGGGSGSAPGQEGVRDGTKHGQPSATAVMSRTAPDPAARRRARSAERQRAAAEAKRSRAARRQGGHPAREPATRERAAARHRTALGIMVLTLGLLIAAVAVTGALLASSKRTQPVTLAAPLHVYPVAQASPGQCPAGTPGITGLSDTGPTCYRLSQGIAIRKLSDLRVQKARGPQGGYDVAVTLRPIDRQAFAELTRATIGRDLAFVVRDQLVTLPRVDIVITDGRVVVTGTPDRASADRLVRELKGR